MTKGGQGALGNMFRRAHAAFGARKAGILARLRTADAVASDETGVDTIARYRSMRPQVSENPQGGADRTHTVKGSLTGVSRGGEDQGRKEAAQHRASVKFESTTR